MGSYQYGKDEVCAWIRQQFNPECTILDVGACNGKWRGLLPEYIMDAIEIFKPNADALTGYRLTIRGDISDYRYEWYDLIIFGDVIEHMPIEAAQAVIDYARTHCRDMIIAIPYEYIQDELYGNRWERHIQDDLTPAIFDARYPGFDVLVDPGHNYCYYHKKGENNDG